MLRRIAPRRVMLQLPLNIAQQPTRTKSEKLRSHPRLAEFFFHHGEPVSRLLRSANPAGSLETHSHSGLLGVFAKGASHHQAHR